MGEPVYVPKGLDAAGLAEGRLARMNVGETKLAMDSALVEAASESTQKVARRRKKTPAAANAAPVVKRVTLVLLVGVLASCTSGDDSNNNNKFNNCKSGFIRRMLRIIFYIFSETTHMLN